MAEAAPLPTRSEWEKIETARNEVPLGGMGILGATVKRRLIVISFNGAVDHTHRLALY